MAKNLKRLPATVGRREGKLNMRETRCGNCPAERINIHLNVAKEEGNR